MNEVDKVLTAVYRKDIPALQRFSSQQINSVDEDGRTPLMHAVLSEKGDAALVKSLVDRGADPNLPDKEQRWTTLHFAARDQKEEIVRALLDSGANVNVSNVFGNTPLLEALTHSSPNLR